MVKQNIAINVNEVNKLMLEIIDCANNTKVIFNKITDLVFETKSYYDCSSGNILRNKYAQFSNNYNVIINNIMSYNRDLLALKKKYALNMEDLSEEIQKATSRIDGPQEYKERR